MKKIICLLGVAVVSLAGLTSCEEYVTVPSTLPAEAQGVPVTVSIGFADETDTPVQTPDTRGVAGAFTVQQGTARTRDVATDAPKPDALYYLEVQQYDAAGALLQSNIMGEQTSPGSNLTLTLTPTNATDYCQLLIVARGSGQAMPTLSGKTLSTVQSDVSVTSSVINGIANTTDGIKNMPYVLHLKKVKVVLVDGKYVIQSPDGAYDVRLLLKRLATRLTVNWEYNVAGYKLNQLLIQGVPLNYAVVDKPDVDGTYPSIVSQFTTLIVPVTADKAASGSYSCWVPANVRGEKPAASTDAQRTKANAPVGSTFFNFVAVNDKDLKKKLDYRVYIGSGPSTDFNLYRNKNYNYTVNFSHAGIPTNDKRVTYIDPIPTSENNNNLVPTANCFMVEPGGAFCFDPFMIRINGSDVANSQLANWVSNRGGIKYVKLLWQTKEEGDVGDPVMGVVNSATDHTNVVDVLRTDGNDIYASPATAAGQCRIYCRVAANTSGGNGLIAAYDASNNILWSWHIWVTDYAPAPTGDFTVTQPANKCKQKYTNRNDINQLPLMDRYIGAKNGFTGVPASELERSRANGMHYQWGRKDPFAGSYTNTVMPKITINSDKPTNGLANLYGPDGFSFMPRKTTPDLASLEDASKNPMITYVKKPRWCLNEDGTWGSGNSEEIKTLYDPCPAGWRVPEAKNYYPLFEGSYNGSTSGSASSQMYSISNKIADGGAVVKYDGENVTYFRFTGYQLSATTFEYIGQSVYLWCRNRNSSSGYSASLTITGDGKTNVSLVWHGSDPHPIRCIQENK